MARTRRISEDDYILTYEQKKALLKEYEHEDMIGLFKQYKPTYKPLVQKKSALDQRLAVGITEFEKDTLLNDIAILKKSGEPITRSSYVRNKVTSDIDIEMWAEHALKGLKELSSDDWDKQKVLKKLNNKIVYLEVMEDDEEEEYIIRKEIAHLEHRLAVLGKPTVRRGFRLSGRVTFNEANFIRWKAARLTLTVADYMRFLLFGYVPFDGENDTHLSIDARKRFYISVIDVSRNGWGQPPTIENCKECVRLQQEISVLKEKLKRLQDFQ